MAEATSTDYQGEIGLLLHNERKKYIFGIQDIPKGIS